MDCSKNEDEGVQQNTLNEIIIKNPLPQNSQHQTDSLDSEDNLFRQKEKITKVIVIILIIYFILK